MKHNFSKEIKGRWETNIRRYKEGRLGLFNEDMLNIRGIIQICNLQINS